MKKVLLSWSSGKDSAWSLHQLRQQQEYQVVGLFCTVNQKHQRVAMHAVRNDLLILQAKRVGLPIQLISIPYPCTDNEYAEIMHGFVESVKTQDVAYIAFGDLFLEDIRRYREKNLLNSGITPLFPLWGTPTDKLAREMIDSGLKAKITCVDPKQLAGDYSGRDFDHDFIAQLPDHVDPCGENGEFHSFVYDGPMFNEPMAITQGATVLRDGFVFTDFTMN